MLVTPKEVDLLIGRASKILAMAINPEPSEPEPTDPGEPDPAEQASIQAMGRETREYWGDKLVYCQRLIKRILEAAA